MKPIVLVDTGPLVAFLNRRDRYHAWALAQLAEVEPPLWTCESVLSEACFLLRHQTKGPEALLQLVERGLVQVRFDLQQEILRVQKILVRYGNVPASLADACLVRMAEISSNSRLLTLDSDFKIYRIHGRQSIPAIMPDFA